MPSSAPPPALFDRALLAHRLDRALRAGSRDAGANFLLQRAADELGERLGLVSRVFARAADVGSPGPEAALALGERAGADLTLRLAPTLASAGEGGFLRAVGDFERLPLAPQSLDLVVSLLALHHANDLPGALIQLRGALKPDGLMLAALIGGETLTELRQCLTIAESEVTGGAAPRVAPFADVRALGGLLQRAGFALPVVDSDRSWSATRSDRPDARSARVRGDKCAERAQPQPLRREVFARAQAIYAEKFADPDGRLRATFETLWASGWAPHESQPKPLKPGSAAMRLEDALKAAREAGDP